MKIRGQPARACPRHGLCHMAAYGRDHESRRRRAPSATNAPYGRHETQPRLPSRHESAPPPPRPSRCPHAKCAWTLVTVHELTRIFTNTRRIRVICKDSWTAYRGLSPCHLPTGGLRPRPRKPTAPCAAGHERALRATRNLPRLPSNHETAPPPPSTFKML